MVRGPREVGVTVAVMEVWDWGGREPCHGQSGEVSASGRPSVRRMRAR
jgi:hypothetical protein